MEHIKHLIDLFLHLDKHLASIITDYGTSTYFILGCVIFCETGLVVTPFLPGDSLLFAAGALFATSNLSIHILLILLTLCAIAGDALNYQIGKYIGVKIYNVKDRWYFKQAYLTKTQKFYEKYGGKTIVIARFVPIVRTFAPFLAGVGQMKYRQFAIYNIFGAILWVNSLTLAGYYFGGLPIVKNNFGLVIVAIIIISILPAAFEITKAKLQNKRAS